METTFIMDDSASTPAELPAMEFLKEEQKQRRAEIESFGSSIERGRQYGLLAVGAIWSCLVTSHDKIKYPIDIVGAIIPPLILLFFYWHWTSCKRAISRIAEYTRRLERYFNVPEGLGWESWLNKRLTSEKKTHELTVSTEWYWRTLISINLILASAYIWLSYSLR
jgi:hypothetical protein